MAKLSAGLLVHRERPGAGLEVLLVHPGGPLWARRDDGAWSIPKGEVEGDEDPSARAETEFAEELGRPAPAGARRPLGEIRQAGGKRVLAWAVRGDLDVTTVHSTVIEMRWPPRSDTVVRFPEVDRAAWFGVDDARRKLLGGQVPLLDRLLAALADGGGD
ncbi:MAG TPA: NUDIX domain-containing protein [Acidimicrobiales bacterium]|nr:NUDIX domain-containing protein [Acidimicrobiales bacterium]